VDLSGATIVRVAAAVVLVWLWLRLWRWVLLLVAAVFLAVALDPLVIWLDARRIRRRYAAPLLVFLLALLVGGFLYFAGASLMEQGRMLGGRLSEFRETVTGQVPPSILKLLPRPQGQGSEAGSYAARAGTALVSGVLSIAVALILTIYLLVDGRRTSKWLVAFAPREQRARIEETLDEMRQSIAAYVRGNVATSALAAVVTYVVLAALKVPAALLLAILAGVCDFIPVLGIIISTIPAVLLALTVSMWTGVAVALFNLFYNALENYYIAPKVYGRALQLSSLAVIAAFAVGAELAGVIGALIALPIAAMYPAIERLWMVDRLGPETVQDHRRIEQMDEH
jgi:predicted PurR-regulated permease PerM